MKKSAYNSIYFSGDINSRLTVVENEISAFVLLNTDKLTLNELDEITRWCDEADDCVFCFGGIIHFTNKNKMFQFVLKWG